ncbi:MAG: glycosyltransferase family 39 protein [Verrucomicrobiota bacterium]|nr:glycosyltransferase family 39 protein [Verrucomicrobiota bacterium]
MIRVQEIIHSLEEGKWAKRIRGLVLLLLIGSLGLVYYLNLTRSFTAPEAMDAAQLARNIAEGRGYTTQFIRPLSLDILRQQGAVSDVELRSKFPDITNPPVYPMLLAALMKVLPFEFEIDLQKANEFKQYQPEFLIWLLNQALFFVALIQVFRLGEKLFDPSVAWCAALLFLGTELYWKFSTSGLPTMLLLVLFLALGKTLVRLEERGNDGVPRGGGWFAGMALWAGALAGLGGLTRYGFAWVILPVLVYLGWFMGRHRGRTVAMALLGFLLVMSPWLVRNAQLSGNLFGTAGLALYSQTDAFPGDTLERTLFYEPSDAPVNGQNEIKVRVADHVGLWDIENKLKRNLRHLLVHELPQFSGSWFAVVCLVGLVVPFRNRSLRRLRVFLLMTLAVFALGQALGRTHLSAANGTLAELLARSLGQGAPVTAASGVNGENLLALLGPVSFLFGAGLFFSLLDRWKVDLPEMRLAASTGLVISASLPMALSFLLPHPYPVADPPYHPVRLQSLRSVPAEYGLAGIKEDDLLMSDIPWAVAWYGNQNCVWLTRTVKPDFYTLYEQFQPVSALYFTEVTTDQRYTSSVLNANELNWERFMLDMQMKGNVPDGFPLQAVSDIFAPDQWLFFAAPVEQR